MMGGQPQTITRATIGIVLLVLVSKGIGFIREIIVAYRFGTGIDYDVYLIGVAVPIAVYTLSNYAFSNLFIPRYGLAVSADDKPGALRTLWADFNLSLVSALGVTALVIVLATPIVRMIAPGLDASRLADAVFITRISSAVIVLAVLEAFFRSVLNAEKSFLIPAAGPLLANVIIIASILLLASHISVRAILYGLVVGYTAQVILNFVPFRKTGILKFCHAGCFGGRTGGFVATAGAILIIEGASQVYAIVDRFFASSMAPGVVSAFGYSYLLSALPASIFAYALSTALFPYLTDASAREDGPRTAHLLTRGITVSLLVALPVSMILWVFAEKIVIILLRRGAFDMRSVAYTSDLLRYFALGLAGQFLIWVLSRAYYAGRKYLVLIIHVIVVIVSKLVFSYVGVDAYGHIGLAAASSISYTLGALVLLLFLGRSLTAVDAGRISTYVVKVLAATGVGYLAAFFLYRWFIASHYEFWPLLVRMAPAVAVSALVFLTAAYALNISDIRALVMRVRKKDMIGVDQD